MKRSPINQWCCLFMVLIALIMALQAVHNTASADGGGWPTPTFTATNTPTALWFPLATATLGSGLDVVTPQPVVAQPDAALTPPFEMEPIVTQPGANAPLASAPIEETKSSISPLLLAAGLIGGIGLVILLFMFFRRP